jgi:hypothetical protein
MDPAGTHVDPILCEVPGVPSSIEGRSRGAVPGRFEIWAFSSGIIDMCGNSYLDLVVIRIVRRVVVVCCVIGLAAACSSNEGVSGSTTGRLAATTSTDGGESVTTTLGPAISSTSSTSSTTTTLPGGIEGFPAGPLAPRLGTSVVWTGEEMIVWGGCDAEPCRIRFADGAAFDPDTGDWRMIAESPLDGLSYHSAGWTGTEMLIVGGSSAAAYSPDSDSWRLLPDPPFRVSFKRPDGSGGWDYVGAVWADGRYVIWEPISDHVAAYEPESDSWVDLPSTGLEVDLGVLRWNGTDLVALGALIAGFPERSPMQGARLVDDVWMPMPAAELWDETYNIRARPYLSGWAGDVLVVWTDSGSDAGRTMTYTPGADFWTEIETIPLPGSELWPDPMPMGERLIVFHFGRAAIYDPASDSWTTVNIPNIPYTEAGRPVWTGNEILHWGEGCCYGPEDPSRHQAWRYTPSPPNADSG